MTPSSIPAFLRWHSLAAAALLVLAGACSSAGPPEAAATSAPSAAPAAVREASVKPGINDPYFQDPSADKWVQRFEIESREIYAQRDRIVEAVGLKPGMAMADIGAGTGFLTRLFARGVGPTGVVYAVDIMPTFLEHIRSKSAEEGLSQVKTVLGKEDSVELPAGSIDLAFVCDTYHHFEYPRSVMASIHRALRPGGVLVVVDFIRIEGTSRAWILDHVRAGEDVVTAEVQAAGFEKTGDARFLSENYLLRFRRL